MSAVATPSAIPVAAADGGGKVLLVVSIMLATLLQVIDSTIANVALPNMQGSLSATQDQVSWVLTSYIVAAAIATPVTGWFAQALGRKRLLLIAIGGFTVASMLCALAGSIGQMVAFRLLQGLFGAMLVPVSQSVLLDVFPRERHGQAMALWGVGVMIGPILGPPLGGWLTDSWSWHWVFLINVPVGALAFFGIAASVAAEPVRRARFDWAGFAFLTMTLGALQLLLDRGEQQDWFESLEIRIEALIVAFGAYFYFLHARSSERPLLDFRLLRDRNFLAGVVFIFILGVVLFATMALLPPFLQSLMGYPVVTTGLLLAPRGLGMLVAMLAVGRLLARGVDGRWLILPGVLLAAISLWQMTQFTPDMPSGPIVFAGVVQGLGLGLVFVPVSTLAYSTLPMTTRVEAASIFALARNIGASVGISVVFTLLARGTQINHAELAERVTPFSPGAAMVNFADPHALAALNAEVTRQAASIATINDFWMMMWMSLAIVPLVLLFRRARKPTAAEAAHAAAID